MRLFSTALVLLTLPCSAAAVDGDVLRLKARQRTETAPGSNRFHATTTPVEWQGDETAIIVCDMWDAHWCRGATARVAEMAPQMNEVLKAARAKGALVIHCPSSCMEFYEGTPERRLAQAAPAVTTEPPLEGWRPLDPARESPLPIDDSDGGCDCDPPCPQGSPWKRQIAALEIQPGDAVTDSAEAYYLMRQRGIKNVIVMGVHANMCVLGRPFAIRQLVTQGQNVVLMRDMTDAMYNSRSAPHVSHFRGNDLVVEHIERFWCPTITSDDLLGKGEFRFADDKRPRVDGWHAGVARVNITPEEPMWLSGYAARTQPAQGKLDDLWAKALALQDAGGRRAVILTMDLVGIDRNLSLEVSRRIKDRYGIPREALALCTSHTHSGPVVRGNLAPMYDLDDRQRELVDKYRAELADKLVEVAGSALDSLQPAKLSWGVGTATFAVNRRNNPEADVPQRRRENKLVGPVDHDVPVLAVRAADGKLAAIVAGYACHATVLNGYLWSGDWPGAAQSELERRHPQATALYWAGCGGDQNPLPRRSVALLEEYGRQFADAVDQTLAGSMKPIDPTLQPAYEEIDLAFGEMPSRQQLEQDGRDTDHRAKTAAMLLAQWDRDGGLKPTYPYPAQLWRLGSEVNWFFLGGEVVVDYSLRIKSELGPSRVWVAGYANDVMNYIPSRRVLHEGGYEGADARFVYGLPAPWSPEVERQIMSTVRELHARLP